MDKTISLIGEGIEVLQTALNGLRVGAQQFTTLESVVGAETVMLLGRQLHAVQKIKTKLKGTFKPQLSA